MALQQDQDVILVLGGVDGAAKGVAGPPQDGIDLVLGDRGVDELALDALC